MPTVIDSFVLEFGLDPSRFTKGQKELLESINKTKEQAGAFGKDMEAHGKRISELFSSISRGALGIGAAFLGGAALESFINKITTLDASASRLARTTGVGIKEISTWRTTLKEAGGTAEEADAAITALTKDLQLLLIAPQNSQLAAALRAPFLNIDPFNKDKTIKNAEQIILEINDRVTRALAERRTTMPQAGAFLSTQIPGMPPALVNAIVSGKLREYLEEARKVNSATKESGELAEEYQKKLTLLGDTAVDVGRKIGTGLFPALTSALDSIRAFLKDPMIKEGQSLWDFINPKNQFQGARIEPGSLADTIRNWFLREGDRERALDATIPDRGGTPRKPVVPSVPAAPFTVPTSRFGQDVFGMLGSDAKRLREQTDLDFALRTYGEGLLPRPGAPAAAGARTSSINTRGDVNSTTSVGVNNVNVYTSATDAGGIARDIKPAIERLAFASQANYGQV